jgi:Ser/Thr protein kinase RdoA (MazF antagonist)
MECLSGGREGLIWRGEAGVHRPAGPWSGNVHRLLRALRIHGFKEAPAFLGFDGEGREVVSFIPGDVPNDPLPEAARSREALLSAADLLRRYHDASARAVAELGALEGWQLPARAPAEVICHGDVAPYNVVLDGNRAVGLIDFDMAHPGPRLWDLAYAVYRWAPLMAPGNRDGFGTPAERLERAGLFCAAYGLRDGAGLADAVCERLEVLVAFMERRAADDPGRAANLADGHAALYRADIAHVRSHRAAIDRAVREATL